MLRDVFRIMKVLPCRDFGSDTAVNTTAQPCPTNEKMPVTTQDCPECECSDPMTESRCHCHGSVVKGTDQCQCSPKYTGAACEVMNCPKNWNDDECTCCPSGVVSTTGVCCNAEEGQPGIDKDGNCCYNGVDGCGICGGTGALLDSSGTCCEVSHH